jgi:hypothetical protein
MYVKVKDDKYVNLKNFAEIHLLHQDIVFLVLDRIAYDLGEATLTWQEFYKLRIDFEGALMRGVLYFDAYSYTTKPVST